MENELLELKSNQAQFGEMDVKKSFSRQKRQTSLISLPDLNKKVTSLDSRYKRYL